jgi:hypothetical protein
MFFTLIFENANGDRVDMTTTANQYMTAKVEVLNPPPGTISTSGYAGMDGSYLNNAFIEKRNVVIHFEMRGVGVETRRHQLYKVVKPSRYIKVYYATAGIDVFAEGYVETCEVNNFEMLTTGQISILCPRHLLAFDRVGHGVLLADYRSIHISIPDGKQSGAVHSRQI